jgi:hypothetical protein
VDLTSTVVISVNSLGLISFVFYFGRKFQKLEDLEKEVNELRAAKFDSKIIRFESKMDAMECKIDELSISFRNLNEYLIQKLLKRTGDSDEPRLRR